MIDEVIKYLEKQETDRLNNDIELIASENYPSQDILDLLGSHFSVKYAEGYPKLISKQGRHYAGCEIINLIEKYAIDKATGLFQCKYANVQPHSGSQANQAVYSALLNPGDTVLAMSLEAGGHLTHISKASSTGTVYNPVYYGLDEKGYINYKEIKEKLYEYHPKLLIVGASAYPRIIDFKKIREIVDEYNNKITKFKEKYNSQIKESENPLIYFAPLLNHEESGMLGAEYCYYMVDMAHIAGLVAAGVHPSPLPYADVVTSTTHKTLRGPRGGIILWNDENLCSKINSGVFPKTQGGPNEALVAAKAQCFIEALHPEFKNYAEQVVLNMQYLIDGIKEIDNNKIKFVTGGSDNHLALLDLKETGITGLEAEERLTSYGIITNKNMIAGDTKPSTCTGLRIGTAAITTRGFDENMCYELGKCIARILLKKSAPEDTVDFEEFEIKEKLKKMMNKVGPFYSRKIQIQDNNSTPPDTLA